MDWGHETGGRILKVVASLGRTFSRDEILGEKQRRRSASRLRKYVSRTEGILQRFGTEIERISVYIRNGNLSR